MNIRDIMTQTASFVKGNKGSGVINGSMLSIGKKGQMVEGVIKGVANQISISFNGVEVALPHTAVQDAREGETRKFQIMDISKDNIVLKEVEKNVEPDKVQAGRSIVSTNVSNNSYSYAGAVSDSAKVSQSINDKDSSLRVITGEDYKEIQDQEGSFEECRKASVERIVKRVKEQKEYQQYCREQGEEVRKDLEQGLEQMQALGFMSDKSEAQIRVALENADIPVNDANIASVVTALNMSELVSDMSDDAKAYIIGNDIAPTISNIYHGQYSGSDATDGTIFDEETWQEILPQVESAVSLSGVEEGKALQDAKWLFANDLPVTADSIAKLDVLNDIKENMTADVVLKQIVQAMSAGNKAEEATLDTSQFIIAQKYIQSFMSVTDQDIAAAVHNVSEDNGVLSLEELMKAHEVNVNNDKIDVSSGQVINKNNVPYEMTVNQIVAKRQVAEICLRMTLGSVNNMAAKGINIETSPLEDIVNALREEENAYYKAQFNEEGIILTDDELDLMQETMEKTADIAAAPASVIGSSIRQQNLITLKELHGAAISETYQRNLFSEVYEQVATEVNSEYGDSIDKAFAGIPDILSELGMEDTDANERAVRILGYNSMELTEENIMAVKEYDAMLNRIISNMKPSVVLDMIRSGNNPLDTSITDLDEMLINLSQNIDIGDEEKYSRYLWQLEKTSSISESERDGYIGIYRLLNSIEKTDGAAIGSVINADKEMTLANLLTAVRTMRGKGIDIEVDKEFGGLDDTSYNGKSITAQINNGFSSKSADNNTDSKMTGDTGRSQTENYIDNLVSDIINDITPSKVQEISDGDMQALLNTSVETLYESMKKASGDKDIEKAYYEEQANQVRDIIDKSEEAETFLNNMGINDTISNLNAAENMLQNGYSVIKDAYGRRDVLDDDKRKEYEETLEEMTDALVDDETIQEQCKKADKYMKEILSESYKSNEADTVDLKSLKLFSQGINLNTALAKRRNYEIPIIAGDELVTMNVTVMNGFDDGGRVQVNMDDEDIGKISARFRINGDSLKGLILCDSREGYERIASEQARLESSITNEGFSIKNISVGMTSAPGNEMLGGSVEKENADTSRLYTVAKLAVRYISSIIGEK